MQVLFTPEQEAQLSRIADYSGTDAAQLVKDTALRLVQEEARFAEGVQRGIAAADRGDFVDRAQVWVGIASILGSAIQRMNHSGN